MVSLSWELTYSQDCGQRVFKGGGHSPTLNVRVGGAESLYASCRVRGWIVQNHKGNGFLALDTGDYQIVNNQQLACIYHQFLKTPFAEALGLLQRSLI